MWNARLLGVAALLILGPNPLRAQARARVCVQDAQGGAIVGAVVFRGAERKGAEDAATGGDGCTAIPVAASGYHRGVLLARAPGFAPATVNEPEPGARAQVTLQTLSLQQSVTVTADRGLVGVTDQATSVARIDRGRLAAAPGLALDDRLHQVAGFQLFRRTSSWTANPTTEGVSLRGLGSTAASRTLVESDEVPLNDAFGGWIHWDEIPELAIEDVVLERGGAADLYGSSAIGGVIAVEPVVASGYGRVRVLADALGASQNSAQGDLLVTAASRYGDVLLAGSGVDTGGYVPTAPVARGAVDRQANVAEQSGRLEWRQGFRQNGASGTGVSGNGSGTGRSFPPGTTTGKAAGTIFLRGNVLNEARSNGTADQTNGTRLWRYAAGGDASAGARQAALRIFGDRETYRQSFSAIAADRNSEALTRLQRVPSDEFGFSLTGSQGIQGKVTVGAGLDLRDIRATDTERPVTGGAPGAATSTSAQQRELGGYAEGVWQPARWTVAASVRVDSFRTFDGRQTTTASSAVLREPEVSELVASPHAGIVRQLPGGLAISANAFRAFRGPTMNELYRTGQVGQQTTMANPRLLAERATGFEFGGEFSDLRVRGHELGRLRASYFWTEVNRPISAVVLLQTATSQLLQRQNLGQIRSRGLSLEAGSASFHGFDGSVGYQLAVATVTAFNTASAVQANLLGRWIPEVPRESVVVTGNWSRPQYLNLHAIVSYTGRTYDDAANHFLLHPYARMDLSADRELGHGLSVYAGAQNLLDRTIDAGRTPVLTLAAPRLVQGGLRWSFAGK